MAGLDFNNPVGIKTFNCFKKVCIIERNTNESSRSEPTPKETMMIGVKKLGKLSHKVHQVEEENSGSDTEATAHAVAGPPPKHWNPPAGLKLPCPLGIYKKKVSTCLEFFNLSPVDRWEKIEKGRMCYSCFKPKTVCRGRKCNHVASIP